MSAGRLLEEYADAIAGLGFLLGAAVVAGTGSAWGIAIGCLGCVLAAIGARVRRIRSVAWVLGAVGYALLLSESAFTAPTIAVYVGGAVLLASAALLLATQSAGSNWSLRGHSS